MFRYLRHIPFINQIFRRFFYFYVTFLPKFISENFILKWRVVGNVKINILGKTFCLYSNGDDGIVNQLYYNVLDYDEFNELKLFTEISKNSNVILDIGANTGIYSIVAASHNEKARIFAFEPYLINVARFEKNIGLNNLKNISVLPFALGDVIGEIDITVPGNNQICDVVSADNEFTNQFYNEWVNYKIQSVPISTVDQIVVEYKLGKIDLIKIDVENYEEAVFKGGEKCLESQSPVILCEIFVTNEKIDFYDNYLKPLGYNCYMIVKSGLIKTENLFMNPGTRNFLFTKSSSDQVFYSFQYMDQISHFLNNE